MKKLILIALMGSASAALVACGGKKDDEAAAASVAAEPVTEADVAEAITEEMIEEQAADGSLASFIGDADLRGDRGARDVYRNPEETLAFFGLEPSMTVLEAWPGGGWYTDIIAPYLASGGGTLYGAGFNPDSEIGFFSRGAAQFAEKYVGKPDQFGDVRQTVLDAGDFEIAPADSVDLVLTFRNIHNWRGRDFAEEAFVKFYGALKPGGHLGVVAHRLPEDVEAEGPNTWGYTKESTVIEMAEAAGFTLVARSEINANPNDRHDYPNGVRTLPPASVVPDPLPEGFDPAEFKAIGESDRMTLKFVKPADADGALLE